LHFCKMENTTKALCKSGYGHNCRGTCIDCYWIVPSQVCCGVVGGHCHHQNAQPGIHCSDSQLYRIMYLASNVVIGGSTADNDTPFCHIAIIEQPHWQGCLTQVKVEVALERQQCISHWLFLCFLLLFFILFSYKIVALACKSCQGCGGQSKSFWRSIRVILILLCIFYVLCQRLILFVFHLIFLLTKFFFPPHKCHGQGCGGCL